MRRLIVEDDAAIEALVHVADKALYRAKAQGGDHGNVVNLRAVESATKTTPSIFLFRPSSILHPLILAAPARVGKRHMVYFGKCRRTQHCSSSALSIGSLEVAYHPTVMTRNSSAARPWNSDCCSVHLRQ